MPLFRRNVTTFAESGGTLLSGDVTISEGSNITITQSGQDLSIAASGGGSMSIGGTVTSGTTGSVLFVGSGPVLAQDNANFFWDDSNNRLGIHTASPSANLHVRGTSAQTADIMAVYNGSGATRTFAVTNDASNNSLFQFFPDNVTVTGSSRMFVDYNSTITWSLDASFTAIRVSPKHSITTAQGAANISTAFSSVPEIKNDGTFAGALGNAQTFVATPTVTAITTACSINEVTGFLSGPIGNVLTGGTLTMTSIVSFRASASVLAGVTCTKRTGFQIDNTIVAGTLSSQTGIHIASLSGAPAGSNFAIVSEGLTTHSKHGGNFGILMDPTVDNPGSRLHVQSSAANLLLLDTVGSNPSFWIRARDASANTLYQMTSLTYVEHLVSAATISATANIISLPAVTHTVDTNVAISFINSSATFNQTVTVSTANSFFLNNSTYKNATSLSGGTFSNCRTYASTPTIQADTNAWTVSLYMAGTDNPTFSRINAGTLAVTNWMSWRSLGTVGAGVTITNRVGFQVDAVTNSGTITNDIGVNVDNIAGGTLTAGFRSQVNSGTGKWGFFASGTANNAFGGLVSLNKTTAPAVSCDISGAVAYSKSTVSLTADNQAIVTANISYISLSSNNATASNRDFVLNQSTVAGQILVLEWTGTNAGQMIDDVAQGGGGNTRLSANWVPTQYDTLTLISNGTDWIEISRSTN